VITSNTQPDHYRKYDEMGILTHKVINPPLSFDYYISDVCGNPIGEPECSTPTRYSVHQYVCRHTKTGNYKLTQSKYKHIKEAQKTRAPGSNWKVIYAFAQSEEIITNANVQKYQWIVEVEPGYGFANKFHITGLLTEPEVFKKYGSSDNVISYEKLENSMVTEKIEEIK
jgi:hypothetical protein